MSATNNQFTNIRVFISEIPEGVAPNKSYFRTVTVTEDKPVLEDGAIFVKNAVFSLDPYIVYDFSKGNKESSVAGFGIGKIIDSKNPTFPVGSTFFGPIRWESYSVLNKEQELSQSVNLDAGLDKELPLSVYNGVLGLSGFTVWDSLRRLGNLKKGETIYISSAAGTLGQLAGQLAKRQGLRVIGSAGSDEKVTFLKKELGFDAAFNYKTQDKREALIAAAPNGIDIYYDLVFDNTVEVALDLLNTHGRIITVGALAMHQNQGIAVPRNLINILMKQIRYEGYVVYEYYDQWEAFWTEVTPLVRKGEIKFDETLIEGGLDIVAETYDRFLQGGYKGKVSVKIADL
ncbi:hypothetical protein BGZ95_003213 [Linnemannia exigua]|uniref:Enoyl reductase (ER) domain-containing protein n=1 Tax=Linnemannia exigua TaxID=604196 RepID=A0AAD4H8C4_9FUNG|nr:hypothetical protein BGZ95_003213 [Linnemannia exigua]